MVDGQSPMFARVLTDWRINAAALHWSLPLLNPGILTQNFSVGTLVKTTKETLKKHTSLIEKPPKTASSFLLGASQGGQRRPTTTFFYRVAFGRLRLCGTK